MDEMFLVDKPAGLSSFGVVAKIRGALTAVAREEAKKKGQTPPKRVKVGHCGTLDPFATGLLIVMAGKATKRCQEFLKLDKTYEATIELGKVSSTGDPEGEITDFGESSFRSIQPQSGMSYAGHPAEPRYARTCRCRQEYTSPPSQVKNTSQRTFAKIPDVTRVSEVLKSFTGEIEQRVPAYSAVKVNGQRAYKLARKGEKVEMPVRKVTIYKIELIEYKWPELKIRCDVSSGTYIRTLGEDIGKALGVGGYLISLRRTRIGEYNISKALPLTQLMEELNGRKTE